VDQKQLAIDSLTKASALYSSQADSLLILSDSLSKDQVKYYALYTAIKEKVLKRDFDPTKLPQIIDSLAAGRESAIAGITASSVAVKDTLAALKKENAQMKQLISGMTEAEAAKNKLVNELKLLKELLDSKILIQAEFDKQKAVILQKWQ